MPNDSVRCRILCELIDGQQDSRRAEIYVRILCQILDKQTFPISKELHWRPVSKRVFAASA